MDEAEEQQHLQSENTRENARSFAASLFRRHKSESSADSVTADCTSSASSASSAETASSSTSDHTDNLPRGANPDMSDATECAPSASASGGASAALGRGIGGAESATEDYHSDGGGDSDTNYKSDTNDNSDSSSVTTTRGRLRSLFRNRVGEYRTGQILGLFLRERYDGSMLRRAHEGKPKSPKITRLKQGRVC